MKSRVNEGIESRIKQPRKTVSKGRARNTLAKVSRPKLSNIVPRKRLFNLLDDCCAKPLVWVVAQPGAGKTALLGSYLEAKQLPCIWYHVDSGDQDPATLFYYLAIAVHGFNKGRSNKTILPALTPEYLPDFEGFVRRWFRQFFALLPERCLIVLDNYQDVGTDAPIHGILRDAISELPEGINIVVLSREEAPSAFARLAANRKIGSILWEDLQLTLDDTAKIATADKGLADDVVRTLFEQSNGWAAGLILMLERLRRTGKVNRIESGISMDEIFNYFAELVMTQIPQIQQDQLLQLAYLPSMAISDAEQLTGNDGVGELLETLFRRRLFTDRRDDQITTYHFHALFKSFLLNKGKDHLLQDQREKLLAKAAQLMVASGDIESAFTLILESQDWGACLSLTFAQAPLLLKQGRWVTLENWINQIPPPVRETTHWTTYWLGVCRLAIDPVHARTLFEAAHGKFESQGDLLGQALAASGVADTIFFEYASFAPADRWITILTEILTRGIQWPSAEIEYRVLSSMVVLLAYRNPRHQLFRPCRARLLALNEQEIDPTLKIFAGTYLLACYAWQGDDAGAQHLIAQLGPVANLPVVAPLFRAVWQVGVCCTNNLGGLPELALNAIGQAVQIVEANGLVILRERVAIYHAYAALTNDDTQLAEVLLRELGGVEHIRMQVNAALYLYLLTWLALLRGDPQRAHDVMDQGFSSGVAVAAGVHNFVTHGLISVAIASNNLKEYQRAQNYITQARRDFPGTEGPFFEFTFLLCEADAAFGLGDETNGRPLLSAAFKIAREHSLRTNALWIPTMMTRLCERALEFDIESSYVRSLIKIRGLTPKRECGDNWPWRVKIRTLGRFEILLDDIPYVGARKAQHKVLDLLKVLIAFGGKDLSVGALSEILWPDLDGDAAQNNFKGCLFRLRKLLGHDDAILLHEGRLSMNRQLCWIDAWAVDTLMDQIVSSSGAPDVDAVVASSALLLQAYHGQFLFQQSTLPSVIAAQDKLQSKFRRTVLKLGKMLEEHKAWEKAVEIYNRTLELDNLSEETYQCLIRCQIQRGNYAEAMNAFRRCRDMFSIVLGVAPSKETLALVSRLH